MSKETKKKLGKMLLLIGAIFNIVIAMLHILIAYIGVSAYQYFGAPLSIIQLVQSHNILDTLYVIVIMGGLVVAFLLAGLYGLSGAEVIRRLPGLSPVLIIIGCIYTLRGLVIVLMPFSNLTQKVLMAGQSAYRPFMYHDWFFTFIALIIGLAYLIGWKLVVK